MNLKEVVLFHSVSPTIKIDIKAFFSNEGNLVVDGYDRGSFVKETMGDWDYEYSITVAKDDLPQLFDLFKLSENKHPKEALLIYLEKHYSGNYAFSKIRDFLNAKEVKYTHFHWR